MKLKHIYTLLVATVSFLSFSQTQIGGSGSEIIDKVVAQVGDNIVLLSEVKGQLVQAKINGVAIDEQSECFMLEEMLYQNLLINEAKLDSTIIVNDAQVNAEMESRLRTIEAQIGGKQKLEEFYGKTYPQIKDEFREVIRERLMSQQMEGKITSAVHVTPRDVKRFYNSIPKDSLPYVNSKIAVQQIVIYPKVNAEDKANTIQKMNDWRVAILKGERLFESVAKINSDDPGSAQLGGEIRASKGMMVKPFEAAVFSLKEGEISDVFESEYGYHFVQLLERKGDDYVCRHILKIPEITSESMSKAATVIDECYARLKSKEITWEEAVRLYSEDENTKQNNGNLSNPYTGEQYWDVENLNQIDPQIFALSDALKVGEFSAPGLYSNNQERKQGVRVLKLVDRTKPHVANLDEDYNFIQKATENNKKQETIANWVNERIQNSFVKIDKNYSSCMYRYNW